MKGNSYNDDGSQDEDWERLEGDEVEEVLEHGRLYPVFSAGLSCFSELAINGEDKL
jgi:hypothetical protein